MNGSEVANIVVSTVSAAIAIVALFQTKRQISLSNKQQLFDRRLSRYTEVNTIYSLYAANKLQLKDESVFYHTNDLIFSWLTNCADLEEMVLAVANPLHQKEQKILLTKYEKLKNAAIEISMVFDGDAAEIAGEFVSSFADLLKAMYQQQVFISNLKEQEGRDKTSLYLENYEEKCRKMATSLGLFELRDKLEYLDGEITRKKVLDEMKNSLRLTRVKQMTKLNELIQQLCPDGVEYKKLKNAVSIERGKRVVKSQLSQINGFPVYQNSLIPLGYHTECNYPANTTFIIMAGAAGEIGYSKESFWAADDCFSVVCPEEVSNRYIYHILLHKQEVLRSKVRKASIPRLSRNALDEIIVPLPPIEVQREIVRILDDFTEQTEQLKASLTAELTARKKQYEYYRDKLLTLDVFRGGDK